MTNNSGVDPNAGPQPGQLKRTLTLPLLVLYGVGVTIGAGIFALIGEILAVSGNQAPLAFLVAGAIAGVTGLSYMQLVRRFPRAGGEAVYVTHALGDGLGRVAGFGVVVTGTISSAVVSLAFGGYLRSLTGLPTIVGALVIIAVVAVIASFGVRESVLLAAGVTLIEVGTLVVVALFGLPKLIDAPLVSTVFSAGQDGFTSPILAGSVIAFFAFIGFEDIANMAEETVDPRRTAPRAIAWTLGISIVVYLLLACIAVVLPERAAIVDSDAPMATLFEAVSGRGSDVVATVASLAMTNGILVQIVMASRVLYGMAGEGLLPAPLAPLGQVHASRRTPIRATIAVCCVVAVLVSLVPLSQLARITSLVTLGVFSLVNLALFVLGRRENGELSPWRYVALFGMVLTVSLGAWELWSIVSPG
jgi:amino acid transporter